MQKEILYAINEDGNQYRLTVNPRNAACLQKAYANQYALGKSLAKIKKAGIKITKIAHLGSKTINDFKKMKINSIN